METRAVIVADPTLNERQKQVLLQIYESFRKENGFEITPDRAQDLARDLVQGMAPDMSQGVSQGLAPDAAQDMAQDMAQSKAENISDTQQSADTAVRGPRTADGSDADPQQNAG